MLLDGGHQRVPGGLDGQEHVGPGVTVRHRVDVQGVDLLAGRRQALHGQVGEPAYDVEVEGGNLIACLHASYSLGARGGRDHRTWLLLDSRPATALSYSRAVVRTALICRSRA